MKKTFTHSVYHVSNNEYYISEYEVLGTWDDTDENWEAFFKRTYPELSNKSVMLLFHSDFKIPILKSLILFLLICELIVKFLLIKEALLFLIYFLLLFDIQAIP